MSRLHQIVSCIFYDFVTWTLFSISFRNHFFLLFMQISLRKMCPYSELFWSPLSRIRTEYEEILRIFQYSVRMLENADQNDSNTDPFQALYISFLQICNFIFNWNGWQHSPTLSNIAQRWCSYKKVSWKYIANLQDSTHA